MSEEVKKYYNQRPQEEWERLTRDPKTNLEFETTFQYIHKYIKPNSRIMDSGAGPGRYSLALAREGYKVTLLDYSTGLLKQAKSLYKKEKKAVQQNIEMIGEASVTDLSDFQDNSFDVVLCLGGVLSHILDKKEQKKAVEELKRISKDDGVIFISVIGLLAVLKLEIQRELTEEIKDPLYLKIMETGDYDGTADFTVCHFFLAEEFRKLLKGNGLNVLEMVGLEGLVSNFAEQAENVKKDKKAWENILKTHERYQNHPSVIDTSEHILAVCKIK